MKKLLNRSCGYQWNYCSLGGVVRVQIKSGEDIAHLGELDQKLWTVLSCPVNGLEFDERTLRLLDLDSDGKIRVPEIVSAARWLTSLINDKDLILKGDSSLPLAQINVSTDEGKAIRDSALRILKNLELDKDAISVEDVSDLKRIFADSARNGDGVVCPSSFDDPKIKAAVEACMTAEGSVADRSGEQGVNAELVEKFFAALSDYKSWKDSASGEEKKLFPYGENTAAAMAACDAIKDKISDYFLRCRLIAFNEGAATVVDMSVDKIGQVSSGSLLEQTEAIASCPIAKPSKDGLLPFAGINPSWQAAFDTLCTLIQDVDFKKGITEDEWNALLGKFQAYREWLASKKGCEVEALGDETITSLLSGEIKSGIMSLIESDRALAAEAEAVENLNKLLHFYRDFYKLLKNYVTFSDFYSPDPDWKAVFEVGDLYIDQRCCKLCIRLEDMAAHGSMDAASGMFLIYCKCTSKVKNESMDIVAVMTDGDVKNLRVGTNAIFYDRSGQDWDAVVTKIIDNPISIKQAFWSPYRKFWQFCMDKLQKNAEAKENAVTGDLQSKAESIDLTAPKDDSKKQQAFDIAKFAGIFAAIGMAIGYIGSFCTKIIAGVASEPAWKTLVILLGLMLCISGPSCFLAWLKLRKRNLGPVLNANGWAINSVVLVNILFGSTLTSTAKYPKLKLSDPFRKKTSPWTVALRVLVALAVIAAVAFLAFRDRIVVLF